AQPIPAQQPVVDGDIPPAQPIPAQQRNVVLIEPTDQQIDLRNKINNSLHDKRRTIRRLSKEARLKEFLEMVYPFIKYTSNAVDYIGGTLMISISNAELEYIDDNPSRKNDVTIFASITAIIAMKALDIIIDKGVKTCAATEHNIILKKQDAIDQAINKFHEQGYQDLEISNAVISYLDINNHEVRNWIHSQVYPDTHPENRRVPEQIEDLPENQQVSLRESINCILHNDHSKIQLLREKKEWRAIWGLVHNCTKGASGIIDVFGGLGCAFVSLGVNYADFNSEDTQTKIIDTAFLIFGGSVIFSKAIDNFVEYKVNQSDLAEGKIEIEKKDILEKVTRVLVTRGYTKTEISNAVEQYLNVNKCNIDRWILRGNPPPLRPERPRDGLIKRLWTNIKSFIEPAQPVGERPNV
ncbi:MAG: hypothetical protein JNJ47_00875, partial [Alphaproteobacteria bacterium]|nr:hypothetical protein [Alphaproteobacteria bacterium]